MLERGCTSISNFGYCGKYCGEIDTPSFQLRRRHGPRMGVYSPFVKWKSGQLPMNSKTVLMIISYQADSIAMLGIFVVSIFIQYPKSIKSWVEVSVVHYKNGSCKYLLSYMIQIFKFSIKCNRKYFSTLYMKAFSTIQSYTQP